MFKKYQTIRVLFVLFLLVYLFIYPQSKDQQIFKWKMVTAWPKDMPIFQESAEKFARDVNKLTNGKLDIQVFAYGKYPGIIKEKKLVDIFNAVSKGDVQMGHAAPYYWAEKAPGCEFFGTIPFGLNAQGMNSWLYGGGGLELWRKLYEPFNIIPFPVGNSGPAMGGFFKKKIGKIDVNGDIENIKGIKIRIAGFGSKVYQKAGADTVLLPASEIFDNFKEGSLDAAVFQGPFHDRELKLNKGARYYYYPGWHEPGVVLELIINKAAWENLPPDLQEAIQTAAVNSYYYIYTQFESVNYRVYREMKGDKEIELIEFPADVMNKFRQLTDEVLEEESKNPQIGRIYDAYKNFVSKNREWLNVTDYDYGGPGPIISKFTDDMEKLKSENIEVRMIENNRVTISLIGNAKFDYQSVESNESMKELIAGIAKIISNYTGYIKTIKVEDYTYDWKNVDDNIYQSLLRAGKIKKLLTTGIGTINIPIEVFPRETISKKQTEKNRRENIKNNRVEIIIEF